MFMSQPSLLVALIFLVLQVHNNASTAEDTSDTSFVNMVRAYVDSISPSASHHCPVKVETRLIRCFGKKKKESGEENHPSQR